MGQAEDGLGGLLSLFQGGDGSARPCDMRRGLRLQTDPAERGRPCRPGGLAAGRGIPHISPQPRLASWKVAEHVLVCGALSPSSGPAGFPFLTLLQVTSGPLTRVPAGLGRRARRTRVPCAWRGWSVNPAPFFLSCAAWAGHSGKRGSGRSLPPSRQGVGRTCSKRRAAPGTSQRCREI